MGDLQKARLRRPKVRLHRCAMPCSGASGRASLLSNLGLLIMGVGAAWSMTQMTSSADKVALVQTALMLPVALLSTVAGAIADMFDRRWWVSWRSRSRSRARCA